MNGISAEGVDPFYPAVYGSVSDPAAVVEKIDWCVAHPQVHGIFHYHTASTCRADRTWINGKTGRVDQGVKEMTKEVYTQHLSYRSVLGISKDGRPIYTPYHSGGTAYTSCEVDVCNGMEIDGNYAYVATEFHPYIIGCYGSGNSPSYRQQCSSNPRECGACPAGAYCGGGNGAGKLVTYGLATASAVAIASTLF